MPFPCVRICNTGANAATVGDVAWSQPTVINSADADVSVGADTRHAYCDLTPGQTSQVLKATGFNFTSLYGKCHADSILDGINWWLHIYEAGDDAGTNANLEIFAVAPIIAGTVGSYRSVSIPISKGTNSATASHVNVVGNRDATTGLPSDLWGTEAGSPLTFANVTNANFGIAIRVRNTDGALTSRVVCSCVFAESITHTAATSAVIVSNASDETGATESGQTPFMLYVDASESKFGTNHPQWAYAKWTFTLPTGDKIAVVDSRPGGTVNGREINLCKDQRTLQAAIPILPGNEGVTHVRLDLYGDLYSDLLGTDEIDVLVNISSRTVKLIKASGGDYATLALAAAAGLSDTIFEWQGGETHNCGITSPAFAGDNIVFRTKAGTGTATLQHAGTGLVTAAGTHSTTSLQFATPTGCGAVNYFSGFALFCRTGANATVQRGVTSSSDTAGTTTVNFSAWTAATNGDTFVISNGENTHYCTFTGGDRVFVDLRNTAMVDPDLGSIVKLWWVRNGGGDDMCVWGGRATGEISTFFIVLGSTSGSRLLLGNNHLAEVKFYAGFIYGTARVVVTDLIATAHSEQSTNGFLRWGEPTTFADEANTAVTVMWGKADTVTNSKSWGLRCLGPWFQCYQFYAYGTAPSNEWNRAGNAAINGTYCVDYNGCAIHAAGHAGNVFNQINAMYTSYRNCYFDGDYMGCVGLNMYSTPIQLHWINNTGFHGTAGSDKVMGYDCDVTRPWILDTQMFVYNSIVKYSAASTITGTMWFGDYSQFANSPDIILGGCDKVVFANNGGSNRYQYNDTSLDLAGFNALSQVGTCYEDASVEGDYPVADDYKADPTATNAQTGAAIVAGGQADYRGVVRTTGSATYLGCTSNDSAPADGTSDAPTLGTPNTSSLTDAVIPVTPDSDATVTKFQISISGSGTWVDVETVRGAPTSYTVEQN